MKIPKFFYAAAGVVFLIVNSAHAALPPEIYNTWVDAYLKRVNVQTEASFLKVEGRWTNGMKRLMHLDGNCRAWYQLGAVSVKPADVELRAGDRLYLDYPCDKNKEWTASGSSYPWISIQNDGSIQMSLRSMYLEYRGRRRWELQNKGEVFAPLVPPPPTPQ